MIGQAIWTTLTLITVEPVLFFYILIIFLESNSITNLIYVKSCISNLNSLNDTEHISFRNCNFHKKEEFKNEIIVDAVFWIRLNSFILFFFQFLSSMYVASWTDKFGKKFPMMIPPIGTIIAASINCALSTFIESSTAYLFISSTISGLTLGSVGITTTTFGFIADKTDTTSRTKRILILEAMTFCGGTVGIYIAGAFLKYADYDLKINGFTRVFCFEIFVAVLITFYIILRIPLDNVSETAPMTLKNLFKLDHLKDALSATFRSRNGGQRKTVLLLLFAILLISSGMAVQMTLAYLYLQKDTEFWTFSKYSIFHSAQFAVQGIALLAMPILLNIFRFPDHFIAMLGIFSKMAGFLLFGLSRNSAMIFSSIALFMFAEYPVPAIRSILSKVIDADELGKIFAVTAILPNISFLIGSLVLTSIFESTYSFFPGFCFECVAGFQFIALCIIIYLYFTRGEIITTYEVMENEDGSTVETCVVSRDTSSFD